MLSEMVHVVDDDQAICESIVCLLKSIGLNCQAYHSPDAFLQQVSTDSTGCVLLDIRMPGQSGLQVQEMLNEHGINLPIIFITSHQDVQAAIQAMKNGAVDFIIKPFSEQQLLDCIQKAMALYSERQQDAEYIHSIEQRYGSLSDREKQVLALVIKGTLNKVISHELGISNKTVELHRSNIMRKMQVKSLAELVKIMTIYEMQECS